METFDHAAHTHLLDDAERELTSSGHPKLAGAVRRASMIHNEFRSRVASARSEIERLDKVIGRLVDIRETLERYVTRAAGPWIGPDLFPEGEPSREVD